MGVVGVWCAFGLVGFLVLRFAPGGFVDWLVDIWHLVFGVVVSGVVLGVCVVFTWEVFLVFVFLWFV